MYQLTHALTAIVVGALVAAATAAPVAAPVEDHRSFITVTPDDNSTFSLPGGSESRPAAAPTGVLDRDPSLARGWPVDLGLSGSGFPYTPTPYDIDGDGADEIFLTGGHTFGLRGDGTFLPGWPTVEMLYMGYGTNGNMPGPSGADFDGDGEGEVLWTTRDWYAGSSVLWCFNGRNLDGSDLPGFPQNAPDQSSNALDTPFVLGDTDGDGYLEAWSAHTLGNTGIHFRVSALDHLGNRLFTVDLNSDEDVLSVYFGDLDGNGSREMFAVSSLSDSYWLHAFNPDGSEMTGYPVVLYTLSSGWLPFGPPVVADLDDDGDLEILLGHWGGGASWVECAHHDGTPGTGFPIQVGTSSQLFYFGLGDVTGDGDPELLALDNHLSGNYRAYAIDLASGATLPGWPYPLLDWPKGFPAVVDVDNDGLQDVCFVTGGGELYALSGQGQLIDGYPKHMISPSISGVAAGDIDGDGLFELVAATWDGWVYAWDTTGQALLGRADWPMRGINPRNTGIFGDQGPQLGDLNCDGTLNAFDIDPFVLALTDPAGYAAAWPDCDIMLADCNGDGVVNAFDIDPFVELLTGG